MMGRNHILTGALALGWAGCGAAVSGVSLGGHPEAVVLFGGLVLWGTTAPDLDAEAAVASSTWAPRAHRAGSRRERLLPEARSVVATVTPGAHWLSAAMRVVARRHYRATCGAGDSRDSDDPHRKLWHTATGAVIMGAVVTLLLSSVPLLVAEAWWPGLRAATTSPGGVWWAPTVTAAPWVGLMFGVFVRGWVGDRGMVLWPWPRVAVSSRAWGFVAGVVTAAVCGASGALAAAWPAWWVAVVVGCAIHVAGDKCSRHGASWWAPYVAGPDGKRWHPTNLTPPALRFRTGYGGEALFVLGLVGFSLLCWWVMLSAVSLVPDVVNLWTVLG